MILWTVFVDAEIFLFLMNLLYSFSNAFFPYHNTSNKEESYAIEFAVARGDSMEDTRESLKTEVSCHIKYESIILP